MSRSVVIHFKPNREEEDDLLTHRLRNFGDDVFRLLRDNDWGEISLDEVDRATTHFAITGVKASKLLRLLSWIEQEAGRQHLVISMEVR